MAVSKELLARYKELKAKGINISLTELKAQMEEGVNDVTNSNTSDFNNHSSAGGVNDVTNGNTSDFNNHSSAGGVNDVTIGNTSDFNNHSSAGGVNDVTNNITSKYSSFNSSINNPQNSSFEWTNTYSSNSVTTQNFTENEVSQFNDYSSNYSNSFNTNFSNTLESSTIENYSHAGTTNLEPEQMPYSGNIPQATEVSALQPAYCGNIQVTSHNPAEAVPENATTKKYALIGYPLGHSLSTFIHNAGFKSLGLKTSYEILETPPETLVDRIKYLKSNNYSGFNVTIPLKLPVTMFLNEVDKSADIVNAVNIVIIDPVTKELKGYNTDVTGFKNAIPEDITLCGKVAGVLGTGGAARAAITALAQSQMKEIKLFTRNIPNSLELLNYLRKIFPNVIFNAYQIERIRDLSDINILVNTTPIGMQGRAADMTPVEENELITLPHDALVYDVIYNPKKTVLIKLAQKHGYRTINGVDMFIHQAVAAQQIWTGKTPDFKDMKIAALENL